MALKHTWKIRDGQPAFEEFVCQRQRWVNCFAITANLVMVAMALNVVAAEAAECGYEGERVFVWWHLDSHPSIVYLGCVVEGRPWLGATLCSCIFWHQPQLIVDLVFAMSSARLASSNLLSIVGSENTTLDPRQTPSENSGYGSSVYTHEMSYSSILLLSLFSLSGWTILLVVSTSRSSWWDTYIRA